MKIKHLEKIYLIISLIILALSLFTFSSNFDTIQSPQFSKKFFESKKKSGIEYFIFGKAISIMPGELVSFYTKEGDMAKSYEVQKILIPAREDIEIITDSARLSVTSRQEVVLEKNWRSLPGVFAVRQENETLQIKLSEVRKIEGKLWLVMDADLRILNDSDLTPSFYQQTVGYDAGEYIPERIKWVSPVMEENRTAYDLFTPPIIFIHDGELTTKIPEKELVEEAVEPFGISLTGVTKTAYPLRLKSWVGETPYFEDINYQDDSTTQIVRNRIEVGKPYKRVINRKPGQPSLEVCDANDSDKMFTVQYFAVQQYRNPETGGLKPVGRAMVIDHKLGGKPFEINTLMKEVNAGNFTLNFTASLPGLDPKEFSFESTQALETFDYGGRKYLVSDLDLENKSITVTKQDPRVAEDSHQTFSF